MSLYNKKLMIVLIPLFSLAVSETIAGVKQMFNDIRSVSASQRDARIFLIIELFYCVSLSCFLNEFR